MNHPCSLCGSRDWPNANSDCPLCQEYGSVPDLDPRDEIDMRVPAKSAWQGSEHSLQVQFVTRAMLLSTKHPAVTMLHAIPSGDWRGFAVGKKLKAEGVVPGVPDLCLPVPVGDHHGFYMELKRKGGAPSPEQWKFMMRLYRLGYYVRVTNHLEVALEIIEDYLTENFTKHEV